ncbi:TRAP transporter substrate-binding protein DctP [Anaerotruncus rubiinfantis]|uniref:TRAP transporter substrate-binding protein DctP n=2 Tax=Anaerotruncus rubiinfantis TaxID=1720200 RepID=UPI0009ABC234|nr:TRAP transporter substrate-binding protein DctP [Anaerotruncus rubiinfantis]
MKNFTQMSCAVLLIAILVLTGCSGGNASSSTLPASPAPSSSASESVSDAPKGAEFNLRIGLNGSEEHVFVQGVRMIEKKIEEKSNGRIQVEVFPNSVLGAEREMIEQTIMGSIEMAVVAADGATPAWVPDTQIFTVPYLFTSIEEARNAADNFLLDYLEPGFESEGLRNFGFFELGFRHFTNNKRAISKAEDMKGLVIRVQESPAWQTLMERLGSTPTPLAVNELYGALQQGVVDGQENPLSTIVAQKFYEVQKHLVLDGHTYCAGAILMNLNFYNGLSDADKELITSCIDEAIAEQRGLVEQKDAEYLQICKDNGMEIVENPDLDSFKAATANFGETEAVKALFDTSLIGKVQEFLAANS